jgi:hypothetical protein
MALSHPFPPDGRYEIRGALGAGGFGSVFRAYDREAAREVAIKVSHERADPTKLARFHREGEVTARLDHPGIVRVHSAGEARGFPYLVYELVEGQSFKELLPGAYLRRRVEVLRDAARALGHAHAQGVVHRDVKADNLLIDQAGQVRVADFGLAGGRDLEALTRTGQMLGTPTHMAPEQVEGKRGAMGPPTDVWSLGVLLYQVLTDELPFRGDTPLELIGQIISANATKPSAVNPRAPKPLEALCLKALQAKPQARPPDGDAFADALDAWLEGRATGGGARKTGLLIGGGLALLLAIAGGVAAFASGDQAKQDGGPDPTATAADERRAELEARRAEREARNAARAAESQARALLALPDDDPERRAGLRAWVAAHPDHPLGGRAREALAASEWILPQHVLRHAKQPVEGTLRTWAFWLDSARALTLSNARGSTPSGHADLRCWELGREPTPLWEARVPALTLQPSPDRTQVLVPAGGGLVRIDALDGTVRAQLLEGLQRSEHVLSSAFSPDGRHLLLGAQQSGLCLYRWPDLTLLKRVELPSLRALAVSPSGLVVAGGATDGQLNVLHGWQLPDLTPVFELAPPVPPTVAAFHPGGEWLAVGYASGRLERVRADGAERVPFLPPEEEGGTRFAARVAHRGTVSGLAFSRDGARLFSTCRVLDFAEGRPELRSWSHPGGAPLDLRIRPAPLRSVAVSPDDARLLVGTERGTAEVFLASKP